MKHRNGKSVDTVIYKTIEENVPKQQQIQRRNTPLRGKEKKGTNGQKANSKKIISSKVKTKTTAYSKGGNQTGQATKKHARRVGKQG